ncbi:MAG: ATP-binding protein [Pirellula sp.]|jgi:signal transduction histidine kinase|nr:ATP-binding protein [Pirellula sp.]
MHLAANPLWKDSLSHSVQLKATTGLLVFATYFLLSVLGDLFLIHGSTASPFWPAAGFGLIATVIFGKPALVSIFFGSLFSVLLSLPSWSAEPTELVIRCIGFPAANTAESWLTVCLADWLHSRRNRILRLQDTDPAKDVLERHPWTMQSLQSVTILTISIFAGAFASALLGSLIAYFLEDSSNLFYATLSWWGSDSTAMVFALPLFAAVLHCTKKDWIAALAAQYHLLYLVMLALLAVCYTDLAQTDIIRELLLCVVAGVWMMFCLQDNLPMLVIGITLIVGFTITATILDYGPFTGRDKQDEYMVMQAYLIVLTFSGLSLHGLHRETFRMNQILIKIREAETIKRYESRLEESSRLLEEKQMDLEGILGTFPDLYFWLSTDGVYLKYYAHQDLFVSPEFFIGRHIRDVVPDEAFPAISGAFERCCHSGQTEEAEYSLPLHGTEVWFEARFTLLENQQVLVVIRNITHRKKTEQQLQSLLIQREKDSEQLNLKAKELVRSNSELEQFAYVASHDLREPLRMVRSFCAILDERYSSSLPPEAREYLCFAVDGAKRMQQMVDELLLLSRVGTGEYDIIPCSLEDACDKAIGTLKHSIDERKIQISKSKLENVHADRDRLEQVLLNLIGNAVKFSKNGGAEIRITCEAREEGWTVHVIDNGIGIESKHFDRIFLMFQRLHPSSVYPGSGVGLALCKKIIEQHGGNIGVDSVPTRGSDFWFTLPRKDFS